MDALSFWQLYKTLSKQRKLAAKRHPLFEKGKAMKIWSGIMAAFVAIYLIFFGTLIGWPEDIANYESYDFLNGGFIIILIIDFFVRFPIQDTPAEQIKQYKFLPISENRLHDVFLIRIGLNKLNLFWMFFFVPFAFLSIFIPHLDFYGFIGYLAGTWLMIVLNGYWYLLWKMLMNRNWLYLIFPIVIYAALFYFGLIDDEWLEVFSRRFMRGFINGNIGIKEISPLCGMMVSYLSVFLALSLLFVINRVIQKHSVYYEIAKVDKVKNYKSRSMSFLNRMGVTGEYLKLEVISIMRNKNVKKQFWSGTFASVMLCCIFAFTDVYDNSPFMRCFICEYCFSCLAVVLLTGVMGVEGNYIDGLMSRKESILDLLRAKYIFNCVVALFPLLFCIPPIVVGKISIMEAIGCMFFTMGIVFPSIFQLAVYNNTTLILNEKIIKASTNTKQQMLISFAALFVPMIILYILVVCFDGNIAGIIMTLMGILGIALSPVWLRNIYIRFMKRRYENMSGFRATR